MRKKLSGMPAGLDAYLRDNYDTVSRDMIAYEYSNWSSSEAQNGITFADENYDRSEVNIYWLTMTTLSLPLCSSHADSIRPWTGGPYRRIRAAPSECR